MSHFFFEFRVLKESKIILFSHDYKRLKENFYSVIEERREDNSKTGQDGEV